MRDGPLVTARLCARIARVALVALAALSSPALATTTTTSAGASDAHAAHAAHAVQDAHAADPAHTAHAPGASHVHADESDPCPPGAGCLMDSGCSVSPPLPSLGSWAWVQPSNWTGFTPPVRAPHEVVLSLSLQPPRWESGLTHAFGFVARTEGTHPLK